MSEHPITLWRKQNSQSQADLASRLGVTRWTINSIEVGRRTPSVQLAKKLAAETGLSLEEVTTPPANNEVAA